MSSRKRTRTTEKKESKVMKKDNSNQPLCPQLEQKQFQTPKGDEIEDFSLVLGRLFKVYRNIYTTADKAWLHSKEGEDYLNVLSKKIHNLIDTIYSRDLTDCIEQVDGTPTVTADFGINNDMLKSFGSLLSLLMPQLSGMNKIQESMGSKTTPAPSSQSSPLARFYKDYQPLQFSHSNSESEKIAKAVYEGLCEITTKFLGDIPLGGQIANGYIAIPGGTGYKQRAPALAVYSLNGRECDVNTGFYEPGCRVCVDATRNYVWMAADNRIKAFTLMDANSNADSDDKKRFESECKYTLQTYADDFTVGKLHGQEQVVAIGRSASKNLELSIWNVAQLPDHVDRKMEDIDSDSENEEVSGRLENSMRDMDDEMDTIEVTKGVTCGQKVEIKFASGPVPSDEDLRITTVGNNLVAVSVADGILLVDVATGKAHDMLLGHTARVVDMTYNSELNYLVSTSGDCSVKVWNLATCLCEATFVSDKFVRSACVAKIGDIIFCFSGGADECVMVWDVTNKKLLYELSTGNNFVTAVGWDAPSNTLIAVTEDTNLNRVLGHIDEDFHRVRSSNSGNNNNNADSDEDEDEDFDSDDSEGVMWPKQAVHDSKAFQYVWNFGQHGFIKYQFKSNPSHENLPTNRDW